MKNCTCARLSAKRDRAAVPHKRLAHQYPVTFKPTGLFQQTEFDTTDLD
ncbi:hypothetical protein NIES4103_24590 [Nostoc sp. NIES-4103]|nr:hypothetical protein NIES4103_24590 [Nostoc sp. NIES-4103]